MSGTWSRRLLGVFSAVLLGTGVALVGASTAGAAPTTGQVYVVQGIVGSAVDVFIDGKDISPNAAPKNVIGPLRLSSATHVLTLKTGSTTVTTAKFTVKAGASIDVVAHRLADATRAPAVTVFRNDLGAVAPSKARLVVSHVAEAPPADIRVNGKPLFRNVANGESLSLVVPAKTYSVDVMPTTGGQPILEPIKLSVKAGTLTRVFAIGDPAAGTMDAVVQVLPVSTVGAARPSKVATGDGGQAADAFVSHSLTMPILTALAFALGLVALVGSLRGTSSIESMRRSRHAR